MASRNKTTAQILAPASPKVLQAWQRSQELQCSKYLSKVAELMGANVDHYTTLLQDNFAAGISIKASVCMLKYHNTKHEDQIELILSQSTTI